MKQLSPDEAFAKAAARCAGREYCRADWRDKFARAGLTPAQAEDVLRRLGNEGFIDEERYARAYAHDKTTYDLWGKIKVRQALRLKGIAPEAIDRALDAIDGEAYRTGLRGLLDRKARSLKEESGYGRRMKLARFAAGRGFEPELVFEAIDDAEQGYTRF